MAGLWKVSFCPTQTVRTEYSGPIPTNLTVWFSTSALGRHCPTFRQTKKQLKTGYSILICLVCTIYYLDLIGLRQDRGSHCFGALDGRSERGYPFCNILRWISMQFTYSA
ncbi:uncharacterized protein BO88DRAFT_409036 [Aspergillus vadensis CBS 113365]|uniref:Uncharacterized protein n=1 Tax=Aspergillus vadensis (strain CBS 113365 / IMI 142717 / IBT 24658) TaxID=1448311 RepID=A0A319B0B7_ASPVC|nr:hypothetical protein BO88DRAFT_409036 [Aspergillus vadensis CBS 113365]PYH63610.1 hypothetical protein BO88DRAFT_409036 [Aspergillus vadensis CBS 113365]